MLGYVYVLSNESMPGLYKIGCTARHPYARANDLYTTGVPSPFVVEYFININNYENIEKLVHKELSEYRLRKEFFKCDLDKCILAIKKIADKASQYSETYKDHKIKSKIDTYEKQKLQKENISAYVYVMSRGDKPCVYKIDYTLENPFKNTDNLYILGTPYEFIVEYCMYIKDYKRITALAQTSLAEYNYSKNFFRCGLIKCIAELKKSANIQQSYKEKYKNKNLREEVEKYILQSSMRAQNYSKEY